MKDRHYPTFALFAFLLAATVAGTSMASAERLQWETTSQQFATEFGQESVKAIYRFTNASDQPVTISKTDADCGCTVPSLSKTEYQPGESGELEAVFTVGSRQGKQHKKITVFTEQNEETLEYQLTLEVDIPLPVTLTPRVRFWNSGDEASTQEIRIKFHEEFPMTITGVKSKDPEQANNFEYAIETVSEGQEYLLKLTPRDSTARSRAVFLLESEGDEKGVLQKYPVYAYVR